MRIAFVYDSAYPWFNGGIEKRRYLIMDELAKAGNEVHMFTMRREGMPANDFVHEKIHYHCTSSAIPSSRMYVNGRRSITLAIKYGISTPLSVIGRRFDLIEAEAFPFFHIPFISLYARLTGSAFAVTWSECWSMEYWKKYIGKYKGMIGFAVEKLCAFSTNKFIAISSSTKAQLRKNLGIKSAYVLPAAVSEERIDRIKRNLRKRNGSPYFIAIGRLIPEKRFDATISMVRRVKGAGLMIIGSGPELKKLKGLALGEKRFRLKERVSETELFSLIYNSQGLLISSEREGLSLIAIEALSIGVPVIITEKADLPWEVRRFCIRIREGSGNGLTKVIENNKRLREDADKKSLEVVKAFSSSRAVKIYYEIAKKKGL
jgi:glycosyltransferase involved in cell wall biosynthesis